MSTDDDPFAKKPESDQEPPQPPPSGSPYDRPPTAPHPPPPPSASPYGSEPPPDPLQGMPPLANRGRRLLARIVDALIVGIPVYAIMGAAFRNYDYHNTGASYAESVIYAVIYLIYQVFMLTRHGQSLGKMLLKVRVGMLADGSRPTTEAALKREATYALVPIIPCCGSIFWLVNVLWCTWDKPYRQCLHDKAGQTVVVSTA
ncbi:RDD family protein [Actinacidiphila soli]|uniref:RDD family protein n=1 Tax=Actinacidiphila soli TaxID=2487275 RepID=UPI000FCC872E|nr:RDD family protein [Actinacidiphila soli]